MYNAEHPGKRKSLVDTTNHNNKKTKIDGDGYTKQLIQNMDINHASRRFVESAQPLVECNFYLKIVNINKYNREEVKRILDQQCYQYPVIIKSGNKPWVYKYWVYKPSANNNQRNYFACIELDNKHASYLEDLFNKHDNLLEVYGRVIINTPTLEICKISDAINAATNGEIKLTKLKSLTNRNNYSVYLFNMFSPRLIELLRKKDKIAEDRERIYKNFLKDDTCDEHGHPNILIIKLNDGSFWLYYNELNNTNDFFLEEIATEQDEKVKLNDFFTKHSVINDRNKKLIIDPDKEIDKIINRYMPKTYHASRKFVKSVQQLVECNFYLKILNINEHNREEVKIALEKQHYSYPVIIKSGYIFWVYELSTNNNQSNYFACVKLDNEHAFYLAALFNQYKYLLPGRKTVTVDTPTFEICKISNAINAATQGLVKLTELKPIEDGCYYSLCLVNIFTDALSVIFNKNYNTTEDRKDIYNHLLNYARDERNYPNALIIKLRDGSFWFYYNKFNDPNNFILQKIATKQEEKVKLNSFFAKNSVIFNDNKTLIIDPDKEVDEIIKQYVPQYKFLWRYYGEKRDGYTDGFLLKSYASDDIYFCKSRLHSYDFSFFELEDFGHYGVQYRGCDKHLKDKFPLLIRDKKSDEFIFCYLYDYELVPIIELAEIANDNQVKADKIYISINQKTQELVYSIRNPSGRVLRNQVLKNIILKPGEQLNKKLLDRLHLKILKTVAEQGNTYQGTQALAISRFKATVSEGLFNDKLCKEDLSCLEALFQAFKIKKDDEIVSLIAMEVNRTEIPVNGRGSVSGKEIYKILERRFGYSRPHDEYTWYFYELFCESVGNELFRYMFGDLVPINQLISIPGEAPGLVSKYLSGGFSNLEILRHYLVQYNNELKPCEEREALKESETFINKLLVEKLKKYNIEQLTPEQKIKIVEQYILEQDNIEMITAATCFLSDIDGKFANMGITVKDGRSYMARVDFGTKFAKLYDHLHNMKVYLLGVDEQIDGINYEQNNNYDEIYNDLLYEEKLEKLRAALLEISNYEEKFRTALLEISNIDIKHLSILIELATARFLQAWHGRAISEASVIKLCIHLFGNDETKWPENARYYFVDENNRVHFNDQYVKQITGIITQSLKNKQVFFKELSNILKHTKLFKIFANLSKSINASMENMKNPDIEDILVNLDKKKSDRDNIKNIAKYKIEDIKDAINLIEAERKHTVAPEQAAFIGKIANSHYWKLLAFFICSLRYEENVEKMWKKYRFLLEKLDTYPGTISNGFKEKLLNFAVEIISYKIMATAKPSNSYPYLIYSTKYSLLDDKMSQETIAHNKSTKIDLSKSYRTYYWTTAYLCFAGQKVISQINEVVEKEEQVVLPIDKDKETAYSMALARGLDVTDFRIEILCMENDKLIIRDYSEFADFVNAFTEIKISAPDIINDFNSISSITMQFCIAVANGNISLIDTLMKTLRDKYFENSISYDIFLNTRLLILHVAIIKNQKNVVAHLVNDSYDIYSFPFNKTIGKYMPCTALQRALIMHNTGIVEILLKKLTEQSIPFEIIDFICIDPRNFYMGLNPVIDDNINQLENLDLLFIKLCKGASKIRLSSESKKALLKMLVFHKKVKEEHRQAIPKQILSILNGNELSETSEVAAIKPSSDTNNTQSQSTLLHEIARMGNNRALAELLKYKIINNFSPKDANGQAPLLVAMINGHQDIVATLIEAMFYHGPRTLLQAFENDEQMLRLLNPNTYTVTQYGPGPSILWFLVNVTSKYYSDKMVRYVRSLSSEFLQDINFDSAPRTGPEKGITLLWLLVAAELEYEKIIWFKCLFDKAKTTIASSNLNASPEQGVFKDISVLYMLSEQVARGNTIVNNNMLDMIINELCRTDALTQLRKLDLNVRGKEGRTVLWNLALAYQKGYSKTIVNIFKAANVPFVYYLKLSICSIDGADAGITPLWLLANAAHSGKPEALKELVVKIASIQACDLNHAPQDPAHQYKDATVAWLLSDMSVKGEPELLEQFFEKLPDEEILKLNLHAKPTYGSVTVFDNILRLASLGRFIGLINVIIENILHQRADRIKDLYALLVTFAQYGYYEPLINFYLHIDNSIVANLDNSGKIEAELVASMVLKRDCRDKTNLEAIKYVTGIIKQHFEQQRPGYILYANDGGQQAIELQDVKNKPLIYCRTYTPQFDLECNNAAIMPSSLQENKKNINSYSISWPIDFIYQKMAVTLKYEV